nr:hypothetical protein [Chlamydiales bacterium]
MTEQLLLQNLSEGRLKELTENNNKALLVGVYFSSQEKEDVEEYLEELEELSKTYGLEVKKKVMVPLKKFTSATYIGTGKVEEIARICEEEGIDIVVFDDEIAPHQQRNLEKEFKKIVIDRTELILGVFARRAQTKEAKIQIDLARFKYQLPRLKRMWTHLERQKTGGASGGYLKGMGERQIEVDRRLI